MSTEWIIREATWDDVDAIARMYRETWPVAWETPEAVCTQFDVLSAIDGKVLIALHGDRVVGHCEFIPTREPAPYGYWGYLEALEVHRAFYRQGIGTALVREAIRRCGALGCTRFGTSPDDERSEGLYRKVGMTRVERRLVTKFELHGEVDPPEMEEVEEFSGVERPWEHLLHVLGRFHCAPYWWASTFHRQQTEEDGKTSAFAVRVRGAAGTAVVFFTGSWLHVFLPPEQATDHALLGDAVAYGCHRVRASGREELTTLMPFHLTDVVRSVPGLYGSESHFDSHMWMPLGEPRDHGRSYGENRNRTLYA